LFSNTKIENLRKGEKIMKNEDKMTNTPFYNSKWWLVLWSFLLWPLGLIMLWNYLDRMHKNELPRTKLVDKKLEEYP
jgi:hypothetical protein